MDEEQNAVLAAMAALDRDGDELTPPPRTPAADRVAALDSALRDARRWHVTQEIVCAAGRRPATAHAHAERIAAIDAVLAT